MDALIQERALYRLILALGPRLREYSPVRLAEDLEECIMWESARLCGLKEEVYFRLPQQVLSKRVDVVAAYHTVLEGFLHQLSRPDLNTVEWWGSVNLETQRGGGVVGGVGGGGGGMSAGQGSGVGGMSDAPAPPPALVTPTVFFDHYRPDKGATWSDLAVASGGMQRYQQGASSSGAGGGGAPCFDFPTPALPGTLNDYLQVYCGTGAVANKVADSVLLTLFSRDGLNKNGEGRAVLKCKDTLEVAASEAVMARQIKAAREEVAKAPKGKAGVQPSKKAKL